jgi:hypothetical protein
MDDLYHWQNSNPYIANCNINKSDFNENGISNIIQTLKRDFNVIIKEKQNNYNYIIQRNNTNYLFSAYNNENEIYGIHITIV